ALVVGADVDLVAGQPGGEAGVLALLADGEGQLVVGDDDLGGLGLLVDPHLLHLGGTERLGDELGGVLAPLHDVDLFAAQLVYHLAHAGAAGTHAGALRVDVRVVGDHGDLGAVAGLAGDGDD